MWAIEEQATIYLISKNRIIANPIKKHPNTLTDPTKENKTPAHFLKKRKQKFKRPRVPIFNINLARIIDLAPLALTWALVNQKCAKKTGTLQMRIK